MGYAETIASYSGCRRYHARRLCWRSRCVHRTDDDFLSCRPVVFYLAQEAERHPDCSPETADGVTATFRVVDSHSPTEDTVDATFGEQQVTVTGSMDPENCNEPTLESVGYNADAGRITLIVGEYSPYGETATVECGNASYDFQCVVTVDEGQPSVVKVTYDHPERGDQLFTVERE